MIIYSFNNKVTSLYIVGLDIKINMIATKR